MQLSLIRLIFTLFSSRHNLTDEIRLIVPIKADYYRIGASTRLYQGDKNQNSQ